MDKVINNRFFMSYCTPLWTQTPDVTIYFAASRINAPVTKKIGCYALSRKFVVNPTHTTRPLETMISQKLLVALRGCLFCNLVLIGFYFYKYVFSSFILEYGPLGRRCYCWHRATTYRRQLF